MTFTCAKCGSCCCYFPFIGVTVRDVIRAAKALGIGPGEFVRHYCTTETVLGWRTYALRLPCPFLVDNRCSIYSARPSACGRYPVLAAGFKRVADLPMIEGCIACRLNPDAPIEPDVEEIALNYLWMHVTNDHLIYGYETLDHAYWVGTRFTHDPWARSHALAVVIGDHGAEEALRAILVQYRKQYGRV